MNKRTITMNAGQILEVEYTEEFYNRIRQQFGLGALEIPSDNHVRTFITDACKTTVDYAEKETKQKCQMERP